MQSGDILHYKDGEVILEEGFIDKEIYIIESGEIEISLRIGGRKITITVLGEGDFLGEMAVLTDAPRSATATAIGKVALRTISLEEILANRQSTVALLQAVVSRLRSTTSALGDLIGELIAEV